MAQRLASSIVLTCVVISACGMAGCSKTESYGDRLTATGSTLRADGAKWNDAQEMSRDGAALEADGEKELAAAQAKIEKGRQMQEQGLRVRREIEQAHAAPPAVPVDQQQR
jgi:outer membrane murein-binding lipoprotein Lpp